jgi:hypothetical protein
VDTIIFKIRFDKELKNLTMARKEEPEREREIAISAGASHEGKIKESNFSVQSRTCVIGIRNICI